MGRIKELLQDADSYVQMTVELAVEREIERLESLRLEVSVDQRGRFGMSQGIDKDLDALNTFLEDVRGKDVT